MKTRLALLTLYITITGCGRQVSEKDLIGKYCRETASDTSVLYLLDDHTYQRIFFVDGNEHQISDKWFFWINKQGRCRLQFEQWKSSGLKSDEGSCANCTWIVDCKSGDLIFDPDNDEMNYTRCD